MHIVGNAHVIRGPVTAVDALVSHLRDANIDLTGNPDALVRTYTHFGIDDARELRERAALAATGERRYFVIAATVVTPEAQNALLKTFEEPPGDAYFFLMVPSPETLLPTLLSRMQRLSFDAASDGVIDAAAFMRATPAQRLELLKPLLEKGDDDRRDVSGAITLLSSLERMLSNTRQDVAVRDGIASIYRARAYMNDKGALVKPLLEHVALLVPVMKA